MTFLNVCPGHRHSCGCGCGHGTWWLARVHVEHSGRRRTPLAHDCKPWNVPGPRARDKRHHAGTGSGAKGRNVCGQSACALLLPYAQYALAAAAYSHGAVGNGRQQVQSPHVLVRRASPTRLISSHTHAIRSIYCILPFTSQLPDCLHSSSPNVLPSVLRRAPAQCPKPALRRSPTPAADP